MVAQFRSYLAPLVIMATIPLTIIGVMPGHALLGAQFTATSMIGMIALAGIIVRNSILLVDFIELRTAAGMAFKQAVVSSAAVRAQPIALTGLAAMIGGFFILDDPIFNGLAVALIFGIGVSTLLTLVVIPVLYFAVFQRRHAPAGRGDAGPAELAEASPAAPQFPNLLMRSPDMTVDRLIHIFAGSFILLSLALGLPGSPLFISPWWLAFTAFVGVNLLQFGFTQVCPLGWILKKAGVPEAAPCAR